MNTCYCIVEKELICCINTDASECRKCGPRYQFGNISTGRQRKLWMQMLLQASYCASYDRHVFMLHRGLHDYSTNSGYLITTFSNCGIRFATKDWICHQAGPAYQKAIESSLAIRQLTS